MPGSRLGKFPQHQDGYWGEESAKISTASVGLDLPLRPQALTGQERQAGQEEAGGWQAWQVGCQGPTWMRCSADMWTLLRRLVVAPLRIGAFLHTSTAVRVCGVVHGGRSTLVSCMCHGL